MNIIYDKDYFINKFEAIAEDEIGIVDLEKNHCALWHCGVRISKNDDSVYEPTEESTALIKLFGGKNEYDFTAVIHINDSPNIIYGKTPKERILNQLKNLN